MCSWYIQLNVFERYATAFRPTNSVTPGARLRQSMFMKVALLSKSIHRFWSPWFDRQINQIPLPSTWVLYKFGSSTCSRFNHCLSLHFQDSRDPTWSIPSIDIWSVYLFQRALTKFELCTGVPFHRPTCSSSATYRELLLTMRCSIILISIAAVLSYAAPQTVDSDNPQGMTPCLVCTYYPLIHIEYLTDFHIWQIRSNIEYSQAICPGTHLSTKYDCLL